MGFPWDRRRDFFQTEATHTAERLGSLVLLSLTLSPDAGARGQDQDRLPNEAARNDKPSSLAGASGFLTIMWRLASP